MLDTLYRLHFNLRLENNQYQKALSRLWRICNFLISLDEEKEKMGIIPSGKVQCGSFDEVQKIFENNAEAITQFLNKEILSNHNNNVFISNKVNTDGNVTIIRKSNVDDKALYEVGKPEELSSKEALGICNHYINLCSQLYKAEQAALLTPENISETWSAILPEDALMEMAEYLMHKFPLENCMAPYALAVKLGISEEKKQFFFERLMEQLFTLIGRNIDPVGREQWVQILGFFKPYLRKADFELLLDSSTHDILGGGDFDMAWAFARMHIFEILKYDYNITIDNLLTEKIVELAINELDDFSEYIDWAGDDGYDKDWNDMLNWFNSIMSMGVLSAPICNRIQVYIDDKNRVMSEHTAPDANSKPNQEHN